ncbi:MAG: glycosyltransferase family 4 protein [Dehalococcoidia bacterium]
MNIWIFNHYATPPDTPGSTRNYDFARELIKNGHYILIFAASYNHRTLREERYLGKKGYKVENIDGVEFVWLKTCPKYIGNGLRRVLNMISYALRIIPLGLKLTEKPDVIVATWPHPFVGLAGWLLAKLRKATFILQVHDLWPQTLVEIGSYSNKSPLIVTLRILEKFLYLRASKIIVLLPRAADYIVGLGIASDKIVYIPNGVSPELFSDTNVDLPVELETAISGLKMEGKLLIVYAGAHGIANDMDTILEAARLLQDKGLRGAYFLLVGEGPEKSRLKEVANRWALNNIGFFNPIPKKAIPGLLNACDIASIAIKRSALYNYGISLNKLWDYMISAKPIIWATNSINDPVTESSCGITVPPEDAGAMAEAIVMLCGMSKIERREMGLRGYDYVMKYHSIPVLAVQLLETIKEAKQR